MLQNGVEPPRTVLIIGGGEFGLSTALKLAAGPYRSAPHLITVLDRSSTPPSADAASSDLNKIVRSDYSDTLHADLARESIARWSSSPLYAPFYHASGTVILSAATSPLGTAYVRSALALNQAPDGLGAVPLEGPEQIRARFPPEVEKGTMEGEVAYYNPNCGWAEARAAMDAVCARVRELGVTFAAGEVEELLYATDAEGQKDVVGVRTSDDVRYLGDLVVLAAGSWSAKLLPELGQELLATGQVIGTIQLDEKEAELYRKTPVALCMDTGFYCFPPTADNIIKFAIHGPGYLNPSSTTTTPISIPRTTSTPGCAADQIPREAADELRAGLARVFPELAKKKWSGSRLCWYCDSPSSDWLLDYHPRYPSLFLATAGSGHAFKFLPIMGDLIVASMQNALPAEQKATWSFARLKNTKGDASRGGRPADHKVLRTEDMLTTEEH